MTSRSQKAILATENPSSGFLHAAIRRIVSCGSSSALRDVARLDSYADCLRAIEIENARLGRSSVIEALRRRATLLRRRSEARAHSAETLRESAGAVALFAICSLSVFLGCLL